MRYRIVEVHTFSGTIFAVQVERRFLWWRRWEAATTTRHWCLETARDEVARLKDAEKPDRVVEYHQ